jgi:hypothetical protein
MKRLAALCILSSTLLGLTGCQSHEPQRTSSDALTITSSETPAMTSSDAPQKASSELLVNRYHFSFEAGPNQYFLTDTATGRVWRLVRDKWSALPPLPAVEE